MVEKKTAAKAELEKAPPKADVEAEKKDESVKAAPAKAAAKKEPEPEPVRAGGHVLTEDTGWAVEEEA